MLSVRTAPRRSQPETHGRASCIFRTEPEVIGALRAEGATVRGASPHRAGSRTPECGGAADPVHTGAAGVHAGAPIRKFPENIREKLSG